MANSDVLENVSQAIMVQLLQWGGSQHGDIKPETVGASGCMRCFRPLFLCMESLSGWLARGILRWKECRQAIISTRIKKGWNNPDLEKRAQWRKIPCAGELPTLDEWLGYVVETLEDAGYGDRRTNKLLIVEVEGRDNKMEEKKCFTEIKAFKLKAKHHLCQKLCKQFTGIKGGNNEQEAFFL